MENHSFIDKLPRFLQVVIRGYKGRVCRRDYWIYTLFLFMITMILFLLGDVAADQVEKLLLADKKLLEEYNSTGIYAADDYFIMAIHYTVFVVIILAAFIPIIISHIFCFIGRMHDIGYTGWFILPFVAITVYTSYESVSLSLYYFIFILTNLFFGAMPSAKSENKWGAVPD